MGKTQASHFCRVGCRFALAGLVGGALVAGLAQSLAALTYSERLTGTVCQPVTPSSSHRYPVSASGSYVENPLTSTAHFVCPVPDKSDLPKLSITTITALVFDANDAASVTVKACAYNASNSTSGTCGTAASSSSGGVSYEPLSPSLSELSTSGETAYLWVTLPRTDYTGTGQGLSKITSLYFEDD